MRGRAKRIGRQRDNRDCLAQHIEELDAVARFTTGHIVALNDRANVASTQAFFRQVIQEHNILIESVVYFPPQ